MKCIIPCAGESSRMVYIPKQLVSVQDQPLISHVVATWMGVVDSFIFVLRRDQTYMWEFLPESSAIVFQDMPMGLADAVLRAEKYVGGRFIVALGDCVLKGEWDHNTSFNLGLGVWETCDLEEINKSYLVGVSPLTGLVEDVIEKPATKVPHGNCGMGVYFLDDRLFDYIRQYKGPLGGGDLTHVIQDMINSGEEIKPVWFKGKYVNVSSPEDIKKAEEALK